MDSSPESLDLMLAKARIVEMEKSIAALQHNITTLSYHVRDTQQYLVKLATTQSDIAKRLSSWPFIAVNTSGEE
jgi:uncharacterized coiled-coil protein SlyX